MAAHGSAAQLGRDQVATRMARFEYLWRPAAGGSYLVLSRATDSRGVTQPVVPEWNPAGYVWNAIDSVRVNVEARRNTAVAIAASGMWCICRGVAGSR